MKLLILLLLFSGSAAAECVYKDGPNEWGWDDTIKKSCEPLNVSPSNPGIRVSWTPLAEHLTAGVTYIVELDIGYGYQEIGRTDGVEYFTTYQQINAPDGGNINICARLRATNDVETSEPSEEACVYYQAPATLKPPVGISISRE